MVVTSRSGLRVGIDAGGTFTDICVQAPGDGGAWILKVPSTPEDPGAAVMAGVREAISAEGEAWTLEQIAYFAHGTTVATNAILQERGARTALITTKGFRDLLEIGRQARPRLYDLQVDKPAPLVPRDLRFEVSERVRFDGSVETPLDLDQVDAVISAIASMEIEAVAVCFLFSYLRPDHEREVGQRLRAAIPGLSVSLSHEVMPEFREYERLSTTVINAFVGPVIQRYLAGLRKDLSANGLECVPNLTQSNGGVISFEMAEKFPVRTLLSGPSTGVVGAASIAKEAGHFDLITFDMGGTSTDVSLVRGGRPQFESSMEIDGRPVQTAMVDIQAVGAGGGSIAWIDSGGHLKVGPESAGADPGPACYGRGGSQATVTDANVVMQVLNPEYLLGGRMRIDASSARSAFEPLAAALNKSVEEVAYGVTTVVVANMVKAIRVISVKRGHDARDYTLVAFGGAGPMHAARLAEELGIRKVLIPAHPGALCALGLLLTDMRADFARTRIMRLDEEKGAEATAIVRGLLTQAEQWFDAERIDSELRAIRVFADLRYRGQNHELGVELRLADGAGIDVEDVIEDFHGAHERAYGFRDQGQEVEAVTFRVEASAATPGEVRFPSPPATEGGPVAVGKRPVYLSDELGFVDCPVYQRESLGVGAAIRGPAIIEQFDTTTLVLVDQDATVDRNANLILTSIDAKARSGAEGG